MFIDIFFYFLYPSYEGFSVTDVENQLQVESQNVIHSNWNSINPFAAIRFFEVLILFANRSFEKLVQFADGHYSGHCGKPCYFIS